MIPARQRFIALNTLSGTGIAVVSSSSATSLSMSAISSTVCTWSTISMFLPWAMKTRSGSGGAGGVTAGGPPTPGGLPVAPPSPGSGGEGGVTAAASSTSGGLPLPVPSSGSSATDSSSSATASSTDSVHGGAL